MDFNTLKENMKKMSREELVKFADTQGVQVHWKAKPETIIKQVMDKVSTPPKPVVKEEAKSTAPKEAVFNTRDQVEAALAHIKEKQPAFETIYSDEDKVVTFRCKGAENCMNMSVPLQWMVKQAQLVSRGRLVPMGLNEHFESLNSASGKNAYTNTVLAP